MYDPSISGFLPNLTSSLCRHLENIQLSLTNYSQVTSGVVSTHWNTHVRRTVQCTVCTLHLKALPWTLYLFVSVQADKAYMVGWVMPAGCLHGVGWARFAKIFFSLISEITRIWIRFTCVSLFYYKISLPFFRFFLLIFASNFSLRFDLVIFASKRNTAKRISSLFFRFFHFFSLFSLFSLFVA